MKEYKLKINGNEYAVVINSVEDNIAEMEVNGTPFHVELDRPVKSPAASKVNRPAPAPTSGSGAPVVSKPTVSGAAGAVKSPLPGVVLSVDVSVGDTVKTGQKLLVLEAMKMENNIDADRDGKVVAIKVAKGDSVLEGAELVIIG
ncbi:MAG: biotin/lipoyl-binding protein [Prevotellaceae bacterium]|jgi:biotin carboxyl carrier protein|nr:biotin/lipoyl-binding protein [Prevotellaceae bacterium]